MKGEELTMATFSRKDEILYHANSYHEAAHAVFAVKVCGGKVSYVKMDDERCECSSSIPPGDGYANHMRNAMRCLAGEIAKHLQYAALTGRADEIEYVEWGTALDITDVGDEELFGSYGDFCNVVYSVMRMADDPFMGGDPEEVYAELFRETVAEVRRLWPEITAVGEALQVRTFLNGDEVSRLIESARKGEE
jgi:hypothetical protein